MVTKVHMQAHLTRKMDQEDEKIWQNPLKHNPGDSHVMSRMTQLMLKMILKKTLHTKKKATVEGLPLP